MKFLGSLFFLYFTWYQNVANNYQKFPREFQRTFLQKTFFFILHFLYPFYHKFAFVLQKLYFKYNKFLPYVNNELISTNSTAFKSALTKLNQMVLIGGPDDDVITPWQSSQFGYFDGNKTVLEMRDRDIYRQDAIGLKTLDKAGKLILYTVPGIPHFEWHKNATLVDLYILPHLD